MNRLTAVLVAGFACSAADIVYAQMGPGAVPFDTAAACYNPATGEIVVSVNDIELWYIESASNSLTGAMPIFPPNPTGLNSDNDKVIGQSVFNEINAFTFLDHNLGVVAATGLALSDLTLNYVYAFPGPPQVRIPVLLCVPEPQSVMLTLTVALTPLAWMRASHSRKRTSAVVNRVL